MQACQQQMIRFGGLPWSCDLGVVEMVAMLLYCSNHLAFHSWYVLFIHSWYVLFFVSWFVVFFPFLISLSSITLWRAFYLQQYPGVQAVDSSCVVFVTVMPSPLLDILDGFSTILESGVCWGIREWCSLWQQRLDWLAEDVKACCSLNLSLGSVT